MNCMLKKIEKKKLINVYIQIVNKRVYLKIFLNFKIYFKNILFLKKYFSDSGF